MPPDSKHTQARFNPWHMRKGYSSRSVIVSVCVSVTMLTATYLVFSSKFTCHLAFCAAFKVYIMWISAKTLCSKVMATFGDHLCLLCFLDKRDSDGFFWSRLVRRTTNSSYNSTDSSLVVVEYQQSFVACNFFVCNKTVDWSGIHTRVWSCSILRHRVQ